MAFKQRRLPNFIEFVAIILALSGTFLLVTHGKFGSLAISTEGLLWGIASAVALAIYSLLPVGLMNRYEVTTVIGWAMFVGGVIFSCVFAPGKYQALGIRNLLPTQVLFCY
jgi:drug/metabolite transporter (DMT)-like permease